VKHYYYFFFLWLFWLELFFVTSKGNHNNIRHLRKTLMRRRDGGLFRINNHCTVKHIGLSSLRLVFDKIWKYYLE
jgi:hypothetical protein